MPTPHDEAQRQQLRSFRALVRHAWRHSTFYRDLYSAHGIAERDLAELAVRDVPLVSKVRIMDEFDRVVTDPGLRRDAIERWLERSHDPAEYYQRRFVVLLSSGSSGRTGIAVYSRADWHVMSSTIAPWLPLAECGQERRTRAAFHVATDGHFGAITTALHMPAATYECLFLSVLAATRDVVESLNAFQPDRLTGYSSSVATLAEWARDGRLRIRPRTVLVSGERLTEPMARIIQDAWGAPIYVTYSAVEALYIAVKSPDREDFTVMDDLNVVEVLDDADRPVRPGEQGRVAVTNLHNYTVPLIRYEIGDVATAGAAGPDSPFSSIRDIQGRAGSSLPVLRDDGQPGTLPLILLSMLHAPGLERAQFVSERLDQVRIDYVAPDDVDEVIGTEVRRWLTLKNATRTTVRVRRVPSIAVDPRTGKHHLVRREWEPGPASGHGVRTGDVPAAPPPRRVAPTTPFVPFPAVDVEGSIVARFERQVRQYPDRLAVWTPDAAMTYGLLNQAANRLARAILSRAEPAAEPVALLFAHGAAMLIALLAVLKAGRAFVALDPTYPPARLTAMLADAGSRVLVSDAPSRSLARELVPAGGELLDADAIDPTLSPDDLALPIAPDALAYILYTSGTTGQPKGVMHDHRGLLHTVMKYTNGSHIRAEDRLTLLFSYSFGAAMTNIFGALLNGAALFPYDLKKEPMSRMTARLDRDGITVYHSVPTVFRYLTDTLTGGEELPALRLVELAGEPVNLGDIERYRRHFRPECLFHNRLGITEMGIARQYFLDHETPLDGGTVPVGYPVADTEILLLDERGEEVDRGDIGEVTIKSRYLFRGYWRQPELTRAALRPDPEASGVRLYRTGDLGRLRPDGCLLYLGRKDARVKIRGYLVDPVEVEEVFRRHPSIQDAVVMARADRSGDPALVAYVVPAAGSASTSTELRRFVQEHLPSHMVPASVILLEALPLLPNDKVDRLALPTPAPEPTVRLLVAPRTPFEEELARLWADVLGTGPVSIDDDFLEAGGHSLLATQLLARVLERFGVDVPPRVFFDDPTVAGLAFAVMQLQAQ